MDIIVLMDLMRVIDDNKLLKECCGGIGHWCTEAVYQEVQQSVIWYV